MIPHDPKAGTAAAAIALISAVQVAAGIGLTAMLGGLTGADLGRGAAEAAWERAVPLLVVAELLKLAVAAAQVVVVRALASSAPAGPRRLALFTAGFGGALLIAASGIAGFVAIASSDAMPAFVAPFGFGGLAATGIWALLIAGFEARTLSRWHFVSAIAFGLACLGALAVPPVALLSVVIGWGWWLGLAGRLRSR